MTDEAFQNWQRGKYATALAYGLKINLAPVVEIPMARAET